MRRVNLNLIAPFRPHLLQSHLGVLQQHRVLYVPKAYRNARSVGHGVRLDANEVGVEGPCRSAQDETEIVLSVDVETGEFGGGILER